MQTSFSSSVARPLALGLGPLLLTPIALALALALSSAAHAQLRLSQSPPVSRAGGAPPPNIVLSIDNSGSMQWRVNSDTQPNNVRDSRMEILKRAAIAALEEQEDGKFRIAFQAMHTDRGFGPQRHAPTPGLDNSMRLFTGNVRTELNTWIRNLRAGGGTPSHEMQMYAGEYLAGNWLGYQRNNNSSAFVRALVSMPASSNPWNKVPGSSNTADREQLSCRRGVHIFMTDGFWYANENVWPGDNSYDDRDGLMPDIAVGNATWNNLRVNASGATAATGFALNTDGNSVTLPDGTLYDARHSSTLPYRDSFGGIGSWGYRQPLYNSTGNIAGTNSYNASTASTFADLAFYYWAKDLQPGIANNVAPNMRKAPNNESVTYRGNNSSRTVTPYWNPKNNPSTWQGMQTYTIGFGRQATNIPGFGTNTFDGNYAGYVTGALRWPDTIDNDNNRPFDLWHAAINSRAQYFPANDEDALKRAFTAIFDAAAEPPLGQSITTAVASQTSLRTDSVVYESGYRIDGSNPSEPKWRGKVLAVDGTSLNNKGLNAPKEPKPRTLLWPGDENGGANVPAASERQIISSRIDGQLGVPFTYAQMTDIGDWTDETLLLSATQIQQIRSLHLHDIVGSQAFISRPPASNGSTVESYNNFVKQQASRNSILFVGANDGMLHGFDAGKGTAIEPGTGREVLAYIPKGVISELGRLTQPDYAIGHRYYVNGSPITGHVQTSAGWKTILAGTLGAGGKGFYLLDVTQPGRFSEGNAQNILLRDYTIANSAETETTIDGYLGNITHRPVYKQPLSVESAQIVETEVGSALIMGNGYNSTNGRPALLVYLFGNNRNNLVILDACATHTANCALPSPNAAATSNGLSAPRPIDKDLNGRIDTVYAGDLLGNLWKFDLSAKSINRWGVGNGGRPLFVATISHNNTVKRQPITTAPIAAYCTTRKKWMVGFGTGRNLTASDASDLTFNTVYGVQDSDAAIASMTRSNLTNISKGTLSQNATTKINSGATVSSGDSNTTSGWYFDLPEVMNGNATKVLEHPGLIESIDKSVKILDVVSINVANESAMPETCNPRTIVSRANVQISFFSLCNGDSPNALMYYNGKNVQDPACTGDKCDEQNRIGGDFPKEDNQDCQPYETPMRIGGSCSENLQYKLNSCGDTVEYKMNTGCGSPIPGRVSGWRVLRD